MTHSTYVWHPSDDYLRAANVSRLMNKAGVATIDDLRALSVRDIAAFWQLVADDLEIRFRRPFDRVLDLAEGIEHPRWFPGGELNVIDSCVARWASRSPHAAAVVHELEDGTVRELTYAELERRVARLSAGLRARGLERGDAVAIYLPMSVEAVIAFYAIASIGAIAVPLFSGFAHSAIAARIADARVKAVFTAEGTVRRGRRVALRPQVREALASSPSVDLVVVVPFPGERLEPADHEVLWDEVMGHDDAGSDSSVTLDASDPLLLAYTSGTTGEPKGAVHTHAGFLVKAAMEVAYAFDLRSGRTFCWITDMGWIMGPFSIVGTHACGGTLLLYEGSVDTPDLNRIWQLAGRHEVAMLGVSPTLIRTLRGKDGQPAGDLAALRIVGSTGEPWDSTSYDWLARDVLGSRVPIINFSGGTEVGGSLLCPYPVEDIASCSLGGPALGMDVDVVDDDGCAVREQVGELVCRQPWPSMTRGIWRDRDRYHETYWSTFPGLWRHGDHAMVDGDGNWFVLGRSDDAMNVAGKRIAPAEIEAIVGSDPAVAEAAAVGVPDTTKGEAIWVFYVHRHQAGGTDAELNDRLRALVSDRMGRPFAPAEVISVSRLPKTRSAKTMRRVLRAAALDAEPGDLSGAEDPGAFDEIRTRVRRR